MRDDAAPGPMTQASAPPAPGSLGREDASSLRGRDTRVVGKPLPKVDAAAKVTGRAVYADDMLPARTLHCRILRSPHPHARIVSVDTSAARRIPGVLAVITGAEIG